MFSPGALCWLRPDPGQEGLCNGPSPAGGRGASAATLLLPGAGQGFECWGHVGPTRPHQGSASPPEGVGLSLDVCAGTQLLHPPTPHTHPDSFLVTPGRP